MSVTELIRLMPLFMVSFGAGIIDLSLGMGFGFTVTPILLLLGFTPAEAVPSVLFSSFIGGISSSYFNHRFHNVDFRAGSKELKIALFTGGLGMIGAIAGVLISLNLPARIVGLYIGLLVIASGVIVIYSKAFITSFSWPRMLVISLVGSLNKGLTGSGFGPVITTGAILSGISEKASVSIQAFAEAAVAFVGFVTYVLLRSNYDAEVLAAMSLGVIVASPFAALIMSRLKGDSMRLMVGALAVVIGVSTLLKYL